MNDLHHCASLHDLHDAWARANRATGLQAVMAVVLFLGAVGGFAFLLGWATA